MTSSKLDEIKAKFLDARKRRETTLTAVYSTLIGAIEKESKKLKPVRGLTDDEINAQIKSLMKGVKETMDALAERKMMDEFHKASQEWIALNNLLPAQMTDDEIVDFANRAVERGASNIGAIMMMFKAEKLGLYDGAKAKDAATAALQK